MYEECIASPLGPVVVQSHDGVTITAVSFTTAPPKTSNPSAATQAACAQLQEYFKGQRHSFSLPLAPVGTQFQQQVWHALQNVEYGATASYADVAREIKNPKGVRAVGMANSRNPIAIIIPCHRIIGADGSLTGYAGGLDKKRWLLKHEEHCLSDSTTL